jgi:phosphotransferase system enzyme I (PtsI)
MERARSEEAAIFDAHQMMLDDPLLAKKVQDAVERGEIVERAVAQATNELADMLAGVQDELFAARAMDIRDVGRRLLRILLGLPDVALSALVEPAIIVAYDLTPSDTASLEPNLSLGFCTVSGGATSHTAILARTLGMPAVVGLGQPLMQATSTGTPLILDGSEGAVVVAPEAATQEHYRALQTERKARREALKARAHREARTADGRRVEVAANIGDVESAREAIANGGEGVGLLRTEFLYLDAIQPPTEEKQTSVYREIFDILAGRPVIVRTLDIGGDKPPSYLSFPEEMNPFLGWRAIRICLEDKALFKTQIRAILQAAVGHQVRIMFPMISTFEELRSAREIVAQAISELDHDGLLYAGDVPLGIMVETPAAAMLVDVLSEATDFFSLGTNDLTQYTLAVDRGNPKVAGLFQPLHPAVLRLIKHTIDAAHAKGKWVGMCGELAGMRKAIPILLGLGLDEFSMAPRAIPEAKHLIGKLRDDEARQIAARALSFRTAGEVEQFMKDVMAEIQKP